MLYARRTHYSVLIITHCALVYMISIHDYTGGNGDSMTTTKTFVRAFLLFFLVSVLAVGMLPVSFADEDQEREDQVLVNSRDWVDVYSGLLYSGLGGVHRLQYIAEELHGTWLLESGLFVDTGNLLVFTSKKQPYIKGFSNMMEESDIKFEEEIIGDSDHLNKEFARRLAKKGKIEKILILDDSFAYNALSAVPYAIATKSWVIFADNDNIDEVVGLIEELEITDILIVGSTENNVRQELGRFNPEIMNKGNRYDNNIALAERFLEASGKDAGQVMIAQGTTLENSLFNPEFPTIFIGPGDAPSQAVKFMKDHGTTHIVLIGMNLLAQGEELSELTNTKLIVKYAKAVGPDVLALDFYPTPAYEPEVKITKVDYNTLTQQVEVFFKNEKDLVTYVRSLSHELFVGSDTKPLHILADEDSFFIGKNEELARVYDIDLTNNVDDVLRVTSKYVYGDHPSSMDFSGEDDGVLEFVTYEDKADITLGEVFYNKRTQRFEVELINTGSVKAYALPELIDFTKNNEQQAFSGRKIQLTPGSSKKTFVKIELDEIDIADNPDFTIKIKYGERPEALLKSFTKKLDLVVKDFNVKLVVLVALLAIVLFLLVKKKKRRRRH